jgi:hypothetical protein
MNNGPQPTRARCTRAATVSPRVTEREPEISEKVLRSINMLDDWEEQRYLFGTKETVEEI